MLTENNREESVPLGNFILFQIHDKNCSFCFACFDYFFILLVGFLFQEMHLYIALLVTTRRCEMLSLHS